LYAETAVLVLFILVEFSLSVMITVGNAVTCNTIKDFVSGKNCSVVFPIPHATFKHSARADAAQNTSWFIFLFLMVALVIYVVRLVIFLRRKRKQNIQNTLANENFIGQDDEEATKPI
jgi:uncharacterized membrane protein